MLFIFTYSILSKHSRTKCVVFDTKCVLKFSKKYQMCNYAKCVLFDSLFRFVSLQQNNAPTLRVSNGE